MKRTSLSVPEIALISGTRAAAGAGIALLLADRLRPDARRAVGWTLLAVGAISTIPILAQLVNSLADAPSKSSGDPAEGRSLGPAGSRSGQYADGV